jgi:hypothetical protein
MGGQPRQQAAATEESGVTGLDGFKKALVTKCHRD